MGEASFVNMCIKKDRWFLKEIVNKASFVNMCMKKGKETMCTKWHSSVPQKPYSSVLYR